MQLSNTSNLSRSGKEKKSWLRGAVAPKPLQGASSLIQWNSYYEKLIEHV